ncbi:hypothetical protein LCGC14_2355830, partial [marine sediment metagenome]
MVLLVLIIGGISIFCFVKGYPIIGVICLFGFSKKFGFIALLVTSIFLFIEGHWVVGLLPTLLIGWNLIGLRLFYKDRLKEITGEHDTMDVQSNFLYYCKDYLSERCKLSKEQAQILVLDPELGTDIDNAKRKWAFEDLGAEEDPDSFLVPKLFDAPQMERINILLDKYASEYSE